MIKECNFKQGKIRDKGPFCYLCNIDCPGEDKCIFGLIFKSLYGTFEK